jgi:hypothetical protein
LFTSYPSATEGIKRRRGSKAGIGCGHRLPWPHCAFMSCAFIRLRVEGGKNTDDYTEKYF